MITPKSERVFISKRDYHKYREDLPTSLKRVLYNVSEFCSGFELAANDRVSISHRTQNTA